MKGLFFAWRVNSTPCAGTIFPSRSGLGSGLEDSVRILLKTSRIPGNQGSYQQQVPNEKFDEIELRTLSVRIVVAWIHFIILQFRRWGDWYELRISVPVVQPTPPLEALSKCKGVSLRLNEPHRMEIVFNEKKEGRTKEMTLKYPVVIHW